MKTQIKVTIVTSTRLPGNAVEALLHLESYLSARLRYQVELEVRCLALNLEIEECGIFVNGNLIKGNSLPDLVDYLHLMLLSDCAA